MRRSNFKLFVIFCLILFLAVGYAVVNSVNLTISGSAGAGTETLDVSFNGTKTVSNTTKGSATVTAGSTKATFSASNMTLNETITYTYTVQNKETDVAADVTLSSTGSNEYFTISVSPTSITIQPGSTSVVTVVVKMIKTPIGSTNNSASFTVTLNAVPVQPVDIISFFVDGVSYQAVSGMTWDEYTVSDYNTAEFYISARSVCTFDSAEITGVGPDELIIEGAEYNTGNVACKT